MANEVKIVVAGQNKSRPAMQTALSDVQKIGNAVDKLPKAKEIKVTVKDDATKPIDKIDQQKVADKETTVKAKDEATETVEKISKQKPKPIEVPVKADAKGMGDIGGSFKDAGKQGASAFAGGFTGGLLGAGIIDSAAGMISSAFANASSHQRVKVDIGNMMGLSPADAKAYGDRISNMFWSGIGESKEQITGAFSSLSSDVRNWGKLTTGEQDKIVKGAVKISGAFRTDVQEPIRAASSMVSNGLSPSFEAAFDLITGGYQTLGSRADDALDTLTEYSGYFQQLGFTGPQALKMIQDGLQAGARDTDYIADAWKEFGIRIVDNSELTKTALKDLGLNAKKIPQLIAEGGPKAQEAIGKIIDKLQAIKDPIKKNEIGVALFGTQWEDTFARVIDKTDIAKGHVENFAGATEKLTAGAVTQADELGRTWDKFTTGLGEDMSEIANDVLPDLLQGFDGLTGGLDNTAKAGNFNNVVAEMMKKKFDDLARSVGGVTTPAFAAMMMKMSETELKAMGVAREINDLGQTVVRLPDGKHIVVDANDRATAVIQAVANRNYRAVIHVDTIFRQTPNGAVLNSRSAWGNAAGGAVVGHAAEGGPRGGVTEVNERGPELLRTQQGALIDAVGGETIVPAGQSAMIAAAAGGGRGGGGWGGPMVINLMLDRRVLATTTVDVLRDATQSQAGGSIDRLMRSRI